MTNSNNKEEQVKCERCDGREWYYEQTPEGEDYREGCSCSGIGKPVSFTSGACDDARDFYHSKKLQAEIEKLREKLRIKEECRRKEQAAKDEEIERLKIENADLGLFKSASKHCDINILLELDRLKGENNQLHEKNKYLEVRLEIRDGSVKMRDKAIQYKDEEIERLIGMINEARSSLWKIYSITTGQYEGSDEEMSVEDSALIQKESRKMFDKLCRISPSPKQNE